MTTFRDALVRALADAGIQAEIVMTDNRTTMVSIAKKKIPTARGGRVVDMDVRVARRFAELGVEAADAVAKFALGKSGAKLRVQELIRGLPSEAPRRTRPHVLDPRGQVHDLVTLAEAERALWFADVPAIAIGWGRGRGSADRGKRLRSIRLGSYEPTSQAIRIHPRLDDARVPQWFVGFIIYHEYLHHVLGVGPEVPGGVRRMHTPEFRRREALHPRFHHALEWETSQLPSILSSRW